ncbi:AraC family transcriptional regulator [Saccharopolyspora sp. NPDC047091]|uniref:AraC family transcriptional regulator n=1 Tax=Saccharopolyspora sp. NPDC047091 TaxID=3155924 RepID=UPI0033D14938
MLTEIRDLLAHHVDDPGRFAAVGVRRYVETAPTPPMPLLYRKALYVVVQGAKQLRIGDRVVGYRGGELVTCGIDLPALAQVTGASAAEPYLAVELPIDREQLTGLAAELPALSFEDDGAVSVHPAGPAVLEPLLRLLRLADDPVDAKVLAAGVRRELLHRVLSGPGGAALLQLARADSVLGRIGHCTTWLREHVDAPVDVARLAERAGMSATTFHRHFKTATGTTPVRFHKQARLHEARRLVVADADALARIASAVGYASASQFSRDYKRMFGVAPIRDTARSGARGASGAG